jgi:hypothetical protein
MLMLPSRPNAQAGGTRPPYGVRRAIPPQVAQPLAHTEQSKDPPTYVGAALGAILLESPESALLGRSRYLTAINDWERARSARSRCGVVVD